MLIKKSAFSPGLRLFFSFPFPPFFFFYRSGERGIELRDPTDTSFPVDPHGEFISPTPPKPPRGLGVNGLEAASVLMNSFQTACCRSHLLLRPGVGNRARDVFVRVMVGRREEVRRRAAGDRAREFSQHLPLSRPGPFGWAVGLRPDFWTGRWSGNKTFPRRALG